MNKDETFEEMSFDTSINTLFRENCPEHFPSHWHKFVEIIAIPEILKEEGYGAVKINQVQYEMHAGDIVIIWPGDLHEILENHNSSMFALQFPITVFSEMNDFVHYLSLYRNCHLLSFEDEPALNHSMFFYLRQIYHLARGESRFRDVEMIICLFEAFILLGNQLIEKQELTLLNSHTQKSTADKIQLVCQYIQQHSDSDITLEAIAKSVGFSACYLSRSFKKATSYSFVEYVMMQRVKHTQLLLSDDKLTISEAAYQAGFRSTSTFNRVFKQFSGCSPSEYKEFFKSNLSEKSTGKK